jgi:hypothetical protein
MITHIYYIRRATDVTLCLIPLRKKIPGMEEVTWQEFSKQTDQPLQKRVVFFVATRIRMYLVKNNSKINLYT